MSVENKKKDLKRETILNKPVFPLLIKTSIPTIVGMLVTVFYNLTDTFFVGLLHNKSMIAAIGIVFSFVSIVQALGFLFGHGSGNIMSKRLGEKNDEEAKVLSSLGVVFAIGSGILIAALSTIFIVPLAKSIGGNASADLLDFTIDYMSIILLSIPFQLYGITLYNQLRLCGYVKEGTAGLLVGMLANMILDPILIFGLEFGFIGAGYATLLGQILGTLVLTILAKNNGFIGFAFKKENYHKDRIYHILIGGMPNFSRQGMTSLALILLNVVAARYGDSLIAALTISSRIFALAFMIMVGWGHGFQPICAMNYGAGKYDRVKKAFYLSVIVGTVFMAISAVALFIFAEALIEIMSKDGDVIAIGSQILRLQCITMPLLGFYTISSMLLQNTGRYFWALVIAISRQGIFYVPLLYLLPVIYGQFGIYLLQPVSDVLSFILSAIIVWQLSLVNVNNEKGYR